MFVSAWEPRGYSKEFNRGDSATSSNPHPLYTIFDRKGILFVHLLLINGTPFTNLVWNFLFLLTAVNVLPLKYEQIKKKELYRRNSLG